ncbi:MAG: acetylxylan esterase [Clostridia bacterium]|nr:acetylxylan esterase [Clostridia bacterium]
MKTALEHNRTLLADVRPSMSYDGSAVEPWQQAARIKLAQLLGMDRFCRPDDGLAVEHETEHGDFREIRFTFQSEPGYRVPCHLLIPHGAERPPVMVALQGHSTGMHISLGRPKYPGDAELISGGDRDFCLRAVKEGFATVAMEQRNFGECGGTEKGPACLDSAMTALLMGRTTVGERVWDVSRLIDVLQAHFAHLLDTDRICCMGNSGGGTTTVYAAALEPRILLAMPSCAVCTYADSIGAMTHCACNYVPHIAEFFDMGDLMAMICPRFYVQVSGIGDPIFPIKGAQKAFEDGQNAYRAAGVPQRCTLVKGNGGHRFYADDAWPEVHRYLTK